MILLLGGTAETGEAAEQLARGGERVLVSTATDMELSLPSDPGISRRSAPLDLASMKELIRDHCVDALVDVTHPYAAEVSRAAIEAARRTGVKYFRYSRPSTAVPGGNVTFASDHTAAARKSCSQGGPVLLTVGTRNLSPYVKEARRREVELYARILSVSEAHRACRAAGLDETHILSGRAPFSVSENRDHIRKSNARCLVTKDGGEAGGTPEKLRAAELEDCMIIVVERPEIYAPRSFDDIDGLVDAVLRRNQD